MTAPMMSHDCLTDETLAAFVDDRLDDLTRRKVKEHLAACGECREIVLMATDFNATEAPANVKKFSRRSSVAVAAGLAAAVVIGVFVLRPDASPDLDDVRAAALNFGARPVEARLAGFPYKKAALVYRGDDEPAQNLPPRFYELLADLHGDKSPDPHVVGVATLFSEKDRSLAIAELLKAYETPGGDHDAEAIDLAAALLARADKELKDNQHALELMDDVLQRAKRPEAVWNRALALSALDRTDEAIAAWDDYLKLDGTSEWATEATDKRKDLLDTKEYERTAPPKP